MSKKALALSIILLLTTLFLTSISLSSAATKSTSDSQWITDYTITDSTTDELLVQHDAATNKTTTYSPVLPGAEISITFTVNVIASGDGDLTLRSGLQKPSTGTYWSYDDVYDLGSSFKPNSVSTSFNWEEGTFEMTLNGVVPSSTASAKSINAVTLAGPSGSTLDSIKIMATSAEMGNFNTLLSQKEDELASLKAAGVDPGYTDLYENVLTIAQAVALNGDPENAIELLNGLNGADAPAGAFMQIAFYPIVAVMAAVAIIFVILFLRTRSKIGYFQLVVEDQIKDLEGLTLRASKIDRAMSANLDSVKDRLKRLVGM
ncbi:MAG: hypothetical protein ACQCN4_08505 [Candidatus Bathyarchaeia archaeon]|jgi:hypothetical protein